MDEHPKEWWEVSTTADTCFRVDQSVAEQLRHAVHNQFSRDSRAIDFADLYGCAVTLVVEKIDAIWHVGPEMRDAARTRGLLFKEEDDAFAKEHEPPEWERA